MKTPKYFRGKYNVDPDKVRKNKRLNMKCDEEFLIKLKKLSVEKNIKVSGLIRRLVNDCYDLTFPTPDKQG